MQTLVARLILFCNSNAFLKLQNGLSIAMHCQAQIPRPDISFATCHPATSCWQPSATLPSALAPPHSLSLCSSAAQLCNLYKKDSFLRPSNFEPTQNTDASFCTSRLLTVNPLLYHFDVLQQIHSQPRHWRYSYSI